MDRKEEVITIFFKTGTNIIQRSYFYIKLCQHTCNLEINCVSSNNEVLLEKKLSEAGSMHGRVWMYKEDKYIKALYLTKTYCMI